MLLGITAIDFIRLRFIEERVELQDCFILVRQALSIFLIGLGGPRDEAIQAKFTCSSSASQAHGSQGADELTFEQFAEDHRILMHQDGALPVAGDRDAILYRIR